MTYSSKLHSFSASRPLAIGLLCAALTGCMLGPNYPTPLVPAPPAYKEPSPQAASTAPAGTDWWNVFNDATLSDLERQAIAANPDVQIAVARVDQADAVRRSVHSSQLPTVTAGASLSRNREAKKRPNNGTTNSNADTCN